MGGGGIKLLLKTLQDNLRNCVESLGWELHRGKRSGWEGPKMGNGKKKRVGPFTAHLWGSRGTNRWQKEKNRVGNRGSGKKWLRKQQTGFFSGKGV